MTKSIPLTQGKYALVDDDDYEWLNQWKWCLGSRGYAVRSVHNPHKTILMHREITLTPPGMDTDHINGIRVDNRKCNLRICTQTQNKLNVRIHKDNISGYKGVSWHKRTKKWRARITKEHKIINLGLFENKENAAHAYDSAAKELFGDFANTNF